MTHVIGRGCARVRVLRKNCVRVTGTGKSSFRARYDRILPRDFSRTRRRWLLPLVGLGTWDGHDGLSDGAASEPLHQSGLDQWFAVLAT
ncbi:hypothetical protein VTN96DRAFT_9179 [Rasamsonia emersonii]